MSEQPFEIKVDLSEFTWDDMVVLMDMVDASGGVKTKDIRGLVNMLNNIVVGGVGKLPILKTMPLIMDAISQAFDAMSNPGESPEKN
ncbi:MAG: hypothetical protein P4L50_03255 [Anaerolineaceae bacterium]|nr:hypothetical protein [Anaerolineaceae bacterium]